MLLDVKTLMEVTIVLTLVMGLCISLVARGEHARFLHYWAIAIYLQAPVFLGFMLRGVAPDWLTIVAANVVLSLSYCCMLLAVVRFNAARIEPHWFWLPPLAVLLSFPWLLDRHELRSVFATGIQGAQLSMVLFVLLRRGKLVAGRGQMMLAGALALICILFVARLGELLFSNVVPALDNPHPLHIGIFLGTLIAVVVSGVGAILMVLDRSNARLASQGEMLQSLMDSVSDALAMFDLKGEVVHINAAGAKRFGTTPAAMVGRSMNGYLTDAEIAKRLDIARRVAVSGHMETVRECRGGRILDSHYYPMRGSDDAVVVNSVDITESLQAEQTLSFLTRRAMFLLDLPHIADSHDEPALMQRGLEMAEELTGSVVSFIHLVNDDEENIELVTWSRRTLEHYCNAVHDRHYPVSQAGLWADALRQRRPVLVNDYAHAEGKRGLPEGHAHLQRLISLPVIESGKVVMLVGIGNKPEDYTQGDVDTLQLLANDVWRLVKGKRDMREIRRFSRMIENSQNEVFSFDADSLKFIDANRGALRNIGYSRGELRAMTPLDIKPEISAEAFEALVRPLREHRSDMVRLTTVHQRKDGSRYPVEIHIELTEDANPTFVAQVRDISERLSAEHSLKQALQVVEASPVVSFRWRAEDGWPVDYVSSNIVRWGYSVEQIVAGKPGYAELVHPDDRLRVSEEMTRNTLQHIDTYNQEYRLRQADGNYFWVDDHTRIRRDASGVPECYEGVVTDINNRKQAEAERAANLAHQIQLNKKLEAAKGQLLQSEKMASIGQLAAGVAHELNNPIGFVYSNIGTLEHYLDGILQFAAACEQAVDQSAPAADKARLEALKVKLEYDYLKTDIVALMAESKDGLSRVKKIVQDLKDFSRAGETDWQIADIHPGIESTLNIVWNELKYKCTIDKQFATDLPAIRCMPSQLNQVYLNLLLNAAQAMEQRGTISIRTERAGADAVRIQFSDTGKGIAPEHLPHIFEPFFTTKPIGKGTGLGLSIVWGIIGKHGGQIKVDSVAGQGTTFTIILPIEPPVPDADAVPKGDAMPPAPTIQGAPA